MDAQDANPEMPKRPAPPIQGGHPDLHQFPGLAPRAVLPDPCGGPFRFPGLAPWAVLPDPCGVLFDSQGLRPGAVLPDTCGVPFDFLTGSPGLFLAQRVDGIDACGPAGRQGAGRQGGQGQDKKDQGEHQRIHWFHSI
ncbi:MAG: hypothetical protein H6Q05_2645 [Acidobacteria bacterium]|nr:hypothetical protein [Acidobacteriota bacterium]